MGVQILKTEEGKELVVLSRREYDALLARAEAPLPESVSAAILAGDSCLKALRTWRGLTQSELAARTGVNQGYISEIENRSKTGTAETLSKLAEALDVPAGWLG